MIAITSRAATAVTETRITTALANDFALEKDFAQVPGKQPPVYFREQTSREAALKRVQAT